MKGTIRQALQSTKANSKTAGLLLLGLGGVGSTALYQHYKNNHNAEKETKPEKTWGEEIYDKGRQFMANTAGYATSAIGWSLAISIPANNSIINAQAKGISLSSSFRSNWMTGDTYTAAANYLKRKGILLIIGGNAAEFGEGFTNDKDKKFILGTVGGIAGESLSSPVEMTEKIKNIESKSANPEQLLSRQKGVNDNKSVVRTLLEHPACTMANKAYFITIAAVRNAPAWLLVRFVRNNHKNYAIEHGEELPALRKTGEVIGAGAAAAIISTPLDIVGGRFVHDCCYYENITPASFAKRLVEFVKNNPKILFDTAVGRMFFVGASVGAMYTGDIFGKMVQQSLSTLPKNAGHPQPAEYECKTSDTHFISSRIDTRQTEFRGLTFEPADQFSSKIAAEKADKSKGRE